MHFPHESAPPFLEILFSLVIHGPFLLFNKGVQKLSDQRVNLWHW